jgi:myo-inositol-1(or 4)-monophosphatase
MDPQLLHDYCSKARIVVAAAVNFLRKERSSFKQDAVEYKAYNDLVSYVDKGSEQLLVDGLSRIIPACGFITEENTLSQHSDNWQWIIDPLDGTTNFVHGLPCYAVSVGLTFKGELVAGIVHEVNLDECFYGWKGGGAWMNGTRIYVSPQPDLGKALLATGFPYTNYSRMKPYMDVFDYCMRNTQGLRRLGSAAVDLAYVACGRLEAFYEYGLKPWDVAAGAFLVAEAGGRVGDFKGGTNFLFGEEIIASNNGVYENFLKVVKERFER